LEALQYVHIAKERRSALESKAEELVFVGYSEQTKGYRLMHPLSKRITIFRDVRFDEQKRFINLEGREPLVDEVDEVDVQYLQYNQLPYNQLQLHQQFKVEARMKYLLYLLHQVHSLRRMKR